MFMERIKKAQENFAVTLDALQSFRPFYTDPFKLYMQKFHLALTSFVSEYWNKSSKKFGGHEIMQFLNFLYTQDNMITKYGMSD